MKISGRLLALVGLALVGSVMMAGCGSSGSSKKSISACSSAQLKASTKLQGATQNLIGAINLTNTSRETCELSGRPGLSISVPSKRHISVLIAPAQTTRRPSAIPEPHHSLLVKLQPGGQASVHLEIEKWCSQYGEKASFALSLPNGGTVSAGAVPVAGSCTSPGGTVLAVVGEFEPVS